MGFDLWNSVKGTCKAPFFAQALPLEHWLFVQVPGDQGWLDIKC